jgi:uncharacterized damage-inducible protein DinB
MLGIMKISDALLPEFDMEMANTRRALERVPDAKWGWKPHEKSGTAGWLATHVSHLPGWATATIQMDELDIKPGFKLPEVNNSAELLANFDKNVKEARAALAGASDEHLMQPWSLKMQGKVVFTMPRVAVLRNMVFNHIVHHRGQLTVYLRLNDLPVPALYGPSADEGKM